MDDLFLLLFFASIICFLLSWIIPDKFVKLFRDKLAKGRIRLILGLSIPVFFIAFGVSTDFAENKSDTPKEIAQNTQEQPKQEAQVAEQNIVQQPIAEQREILKLSILQPENNASLKTDAAEIKGNVSNKDAKVALVDSKKVIAVDPSGNFSVSVNLNKGENKFTIIAEKDGMKTDKEITIKRELTAEEIRKQFKTESKSISYKELFRNISQYKDQKVYYTGKVVQVIGDGNFLSSMRVEVTRGSYGIWDDVVLLNILDAEAPKILEDDVIKFWGTVQGEQSYETVLGATITVPEIDAEIIELSK